MIKKGKNVNKSLQIRYWRMWRRVPIDTPLTEEIISFAAKIKQVFKIEFHIFQLFAIDAACRHNDILMRSAIDSGKDLIYQSLDIILYICPILDAMETAV